MSPVEAFAKLRKENLAKISPHKTESTNSFRLAHVYTTTTNTDLEKVLFNLKGLFKRNCKIAQGKNMHIEEWTELIKSKALVDDHLSEQQVRGCFQSSKLTVIDEGNSIQARRLTFSDFLEAIVRIAHSKAWSAEDFNLPEADPVPPHQQNLRRLLKILLTLNLVTSHRNRKGEKEKANGNKK